MVITPFMLLLCVCVMSLDFLFPAWGLDSSACRFSLSFHSDMSSNLQHYGALNNIMGSWEIFLMARSLTTIGLCL